MWIPLLLDSLNYKDMKEKGLRLSPEEIYSINQSSLKDAVVIFGNGCTAELISSEGLLITNHHCGYSRIQSHSTVEKDLLTDGFWAQSLSDELPNPGLSVTFLVRMENVTDRILEGIPDSIPEAERDQKTIVNINKVRNEAIENTRYQAEIKPFYFGREYYLFVYEIYNDVRLVGAPPEAIGRFGGDTDNWIWPRHTGDFSLFRIYAGKDNQPAEYSAENVPFKPKKFLNISAKGVHEGDFTMVMGYPAHTDEYLTSDALDMIALKALPAKTEMRTLRLKALQEEMAKGPEFKLKYAAKYVSISNSWKKWIGVTNGIKRGNTIEKKKQLEQSFNTWASNLSCDTEGYRTLIKDFSDLYSKYEPLYLANDLGRELLGSIEISNLVNRVQTKYFTTIDSSGVIKEEAIRSIQKMGGSFLRTRVQEIDMKILPSLLQIYATNTAEPFHPDFFRKVNEEFKGNFSAYVEDVFRKSIYTDSVRFHKTFSRSDKSIRKTLDNDPLIAIYRDFSRILLADNFDRIDSMDLAINRYYRKYITGLTAMYPDHRFYPDANFSMRLTYGNVKGYEPADAVSYSCYSTLDGIIEKEDSTVTDYRVPEYLKTLYRNHDYGSYSADGKVPVCFIATNHTSGGNSGSPVLDGEGNLIGVNFDRNWEGTVSDYAYDPDFCRNICLDIRYVLFTIDKVAHAGRILDELTIINQ